MIDLNRLTDQRRDAWSPGHSGNLAADRVRVELRQLVTAGRLAKEQDDVGLVTAPGHPARPGKATVTAVLRQIRRI